MERITQGSLVKLNPKNLFEIRIKFIGDHNNHFLKQVPIKEFEKELTFLTYEKSHFDKAENKEYQLCRVRGLQVTVEKNRKIDISELLIPVDCLTIIKQQYKHE